MDGYDNDWVLMLDDDLFFLGDDYYVKPDVHPADTDNKTGHEHGALCWQSSSNAPASSDN